MTDAYRSTTNTCPACAAPLREFAKRLVCDQCSGIMLAAKDFTAACEDVAGIDLALEVHAGTPTETPCPRCGVSLVNATVSLGEKTLKSRFLSCERDGLWCAPGVLTGLRNTHVERVAKTIERLQVDGQAAPDLDSHDAAAALCAMVEGFARHWFGRGEEHDEDVAVATLTQLWARSLGLDGHRPGHARTRRTRDALHR